jgi:hypothetical protein
VPDLSPQGDYLTLEEPTISDLEEQSLMRDNPLIIDLSVSILIQVVPPAC